MLSRTAFLLALALAFSLPLPAAADDVPGPAKASAGSSAAKRDRPFTARPVVVGILAALFLIVAGAAGANDKKKPAA